MSIPSDQTRSRRPWWKVFLGLLLVSHLVWFVRDPAAPVPEGWHQGDFRVDESDQVGALVQSAPQTLAWRWSGSDDPASPTLVLLHGSPGRGSNFDPLAAALPPNLRVLSVDLPGFGASRPLGPDLSARRAARLLKLLLDSQLVEGVHLLGWSMGGAVALELAELEPARVKSLYLLASLGAIEFELLGSHPLNHGLHALLLQGSYGLRWGLPHFGAWDGMAPLVAFARNFAETDQRRLRGIMGRLDLPVRIVHGAQDPLITVAAAREHGRILPQAEVLILDDKSHFLPFTWTPELAQDLSGWIQKVEAQKALHRSAASPQRLARARLPFDPHDIPPLAGPALLLFGLLLALATLASEDLACIAAGFLVADGRMDWMSASLFCFAGIFVGDMLLFGAGRFLGRSALSIPPFKWMLTEDGLARASHWLQSRGSKVVLISRFLPGLRLPIYFASGLLRTRARDFALWFAVAGLVWTPILVGATALIARQFEVRLDQVTGADLVQLALTALLAVFCLHSGLRLITWRGRRLLLGAWYRWTRHEFWPPWLYYTPVILDVLWMAVRHRGLTLTAANPAMPLGGLIGESKSDILLGLGSGPAVPRWTLLWPKESPLRQATSWMAKENLSLPLVLKPDQGQRGMGVQILHTHESLKDALAALTTPSILMEYAGGHEFGVFWVHPPGAEKGEIVSVTVKKMPQVIGDGARTLSQLILADPRAVAIHGVYSRENPGRMESVPRDGERITLVEVGTHSRGALFLDGGHLITPALEEAIAGIAAPYEGFHLGRFDLKAPSPEHLMRGEGLRVIELNGVSSEQTEMWDPKYSLLTTWRMQHDQWARAFAVGKLCAQAGTPVISIREVLKEVWRFRARSKP